MLKKVHDFLTPLRFRFFFRLFRILERACPPLFRIRLTVHRAVTCFRNSQVNKIGNGNQQRTTRWTKNRTDAYWSTFKSDCHTLVSLPCVFIYTGCPIWNVPRNQFSRKYPRLTWCDNHFREEQSRDRQKLWNKTKRFCCDERYNFFFHEFMFV